MNDDLREAVLKLKRERIVAVAVEMFYLNGFGRTTLDQVAHGMRVTKPFIYAHFRSKNELLAVICAQGIQASLKAVDRALAAQGSAGDRLAAFSHDFMLSVLESRKPIVIYSREEKNLSAEDSEAIKCMRREFDRKLVGLLDQGVANGEFDIEQTKIAALAIGGIATWASVWFRPGGRLPIEKIASGMSTLVLAMSNVDVPSASRSSERAGEKHTCW